MVCSGERKPPPKLISASALRNAPVVDSADLGKTLVFETGVSETPFALGTYLGVVRKVPRLWARELHDSNPELSTVYRENRNLRRIQDVRQDIIDGLEPNRMLFVGRQQPGGAPLGQPTWFAATDKRRVAERLDVPSPQVKNIQSLSMPVAEIPSVWKGEHKKKLSPAELTVGETASDHEDIGIAIVLCHHVFLLGYVFSNILSRPSHPQTTHLRRIFVVIA